MTSRAPTIFILAVPVLVGFNLAELQVLVTNYFLGRDLPSTQWFQVVFWVWAITALGSAWLGLHGAYLAIRSHDITNGYLKAFVIILCFMIHVDGKDLGWSAFRLSFYLGINHFAVGVNFVGLAAYLWYWRLRELASRPLAPLQSDATNRAV